MRGRGCSNHGTSASVNWGTIETPCDNARRSAVRVEWLRLFSQSRRGVAFTRPKGEKFEEEERKSVAHFTRINTTT